MIGQCEAPHTWLYRYGFLNSIILRAKNMAGTCEDDFFNDSILQFLREPTGSELKELMEGADAFIEKIENKAQHRNEPRPIFEAATPDDLQKFQGEKLKQKYNKVCNYKLFRSMEDMAKAAPQARGTILRGGMQI